MDTAHAEYLSKEVMSFHTVEKEPFVEVLKTFVEQHMLPGLLLLASNNIISKLMVDKCVQSLNLNAHAYNTSILNVPLCPMLYFLSIPTLTNELLAWSHMTQSICSLNSPKL